MSTHRDNNESGLERTSKPTQSTSFEIDEEVFSPTGYLKEAGSWLLREMIYLTVPGSFVYAVRTSTKERSPEEVMSAYKIAHIFEGLRSGMYGIGIACSVI